MKRSLRFGLIILISIFSLLLCNCDNSYEKMLEEFDGKYFSPEPLGYDPFSVNAPNFNPNSMLDASYVFPEGYYITLEAPNNCTSYLWTCTNSDFEKKEIGSERVLYYEIPGIFKKGEENTLILTVTAADEDGSITEYIDESVIIIKAQKDLD